MKFKGYELKDRINNLNKDSVFSGTFRLCKAFIPHSTRIMLPFCS